jgi:hypothetical protein
MQASKKTFVGSMPIFSSMIPDQLSKRLKIFFKIYPDSKELRLAYLQALAEKGDETAVLEEWVKGKDELQKDRHALEILAWGVLKKGDLSSQLAIHLSALIGALLDAGCAGRSDARECPERHQCFASADSSKVLWTVR